MRNIYIKQYPYNFVMGCRMRERAQVKLSLAQLQCQVKQIIIVL